MTTMAPKIQGKKKVYSIECPCSRKVILSRFQLSMFVQPQDRTAHEFWGAGAGGCWRREEHRWWANFVRHHHHLKATRVLRQNLTFAIIGFRQLIHCNISFDFLSFFFLQILHNLPWLIVTVSRLPPFLLRENLFRLNMPWMLSLKVLHLSVSKVTFDETSINFINYSTTW